MKNSFLLTTHDAATIDCTRWTVEHPVLILQIAHGMAEHLDRYDAFARYLNAYNISVYGNNHRGHGPLAQKEGTLGHLADEGGWDKCVSDLHTLTLHLQKIYPDVPRVLFGHSMGSFMARSYLKKYSYDIDGCILSGTGGLAGPREKGGHVLAKFLTLLKGKGSPGVFPDRLAFGANNKDFEPARTKFDWLSRDEEEVDAYIRDPLCGFICSHQFYVDLTEGLLEISDAQGIISLNRKLPLLFISGDKDPVGEKGKAFEEVLDFYKKLGMRNLQLQLFEGARHEILFELQAEEVKAFIVDWIDKNVKKLTEL